MSQVTAKKNAIERNKNLKNIRGTKAVKKCSTLIIKKTVYVWEVPPVLWPGFWGGICPWPTGLYKQLALCSDALLI